jgi:hypothetical protein
VSINIYPYCRVFLSSDSSPSPSEKTYIFQTSLEQKPFLTCTFPFEVFLKNLNFSVENYPSDTLLIISVFSAGKWISNVFECKDVNSLTDLCNAPISKIKIELDGLSCLTISNISIEVDDLIFARDLLCCGPYSISYSPFYGLGGKLAVLASSIEYGIWNNSRYHFLYWEDNLASNLIDYPIPLDFDDLKYFLDLNENDLPYCIKCDSGNLPDPYKVAYYRPKKLKYNEQYPVAFVSRDDINLFRGEHESDFSLMRRLYSKITVNFNFLSTVQQDFRETKIQLGGGDIFGIQIRHGNGEYYNNGEFYSVKAPPRDGVLNQVCSIINNNPKITGCIIASDCFFASNVLAEYLAANFKNIKCLVLDSYSIPLVSVLCIIMKFLIL